MQPLPLRCWYLALSLMLGGPLPCLAAEEDTPAHPDLAQKIAADYYEARDAAQKARQAWRQAVRARGQAKKQGKAFRSVLNDCFARDETLRNQAEENLDAYKQAKRALCRGKKAQGRLDEAVGQAKKVHNQAKRAHRISKVHLIQEAVQATQKILDNVQQARQQALDNFQQAEALFLEVAATFEHLLATLGQDQGVSIPEEPAQQSATAEGKALPQSPGVLLRYGAPALTFVPLLGSLAYIGYHLLVPPKRQPVPSSPKPTLLSSMWRPLLKLFAGPVATLYLVVRYVYGPLSQPHESPTNEQAVQKSVPQEPPEKAIPQQATRESPAQPLQEATDSQPQDRPDQPLLQPAPAPEPQPTPPRSWRNVSALLLSATVGAAYPWVKQAVQGLRALWQPVPAPRPVVAPPGASEDTQDIL